MNAGQFQDCRAILLDFGGTLDSDGEHWLDRFYALYEWAGLRHVGPNEIKRAFYHADSLCHGNPQVVYGGLRHLMRYHVGLQFQALNLEDSEKEEAMVEAFCTKSEALSAAKCSCAPPSEAKVSPRRGV